MEATALFYQVYPDFQPKIGHVLAEMMRTTLEDCRLNE
jgi:hypothetical protein